MPSTTYNKTREEALSERRWRIVDAQDKVLGRLASKVAIALRGKDKATFTPYVDDGDFVVVVNAEKVTLTGQKLLRKKYYSHSGYTSGLKEISAGELREKKPEEMIKKAVKGMLPKGSLGQQMLKKLKVYRGATHPHEAQKPAPMEV